jgi:two-component sensor histidine kinase
MGKAYYFLKNWQQAKTYYEESEKMALKLKFTDGRLTNLPALIQVDTILGNYKHAFSTFSKYHQLYESQLNEAKQKEIMELDKKYESQNQALLIQSKDKELNQKQQTMLIMVLCMIGIGLLSLYLFYLFRKNRKLSRYNQLLLREQNHRVKNNLQMISSLLSLQSQKLKTSDAKAVLEDSQGRINSVALLHRMLYEGEQVGTIEAVSYIKSLTGEIKYSANRDVDIELTLPETLELKIERVTSLGLIINELFTNSIKHVSSETPLRITLQLEQSNGKLNIAYSDNGEGVSAEQWMASNSFGNQLIQLQSRQLQGDFTVSADHGFNFGLRIPA